MDAKAAYMSKPWLKHYPQGVPHTVDIPEISIPQMFDQAAEKFRSKTALIFYGKKISYGELKELTDRFAGALSQLGVKKGDTVALYLLNCPQYVIAYFGALKAGAKVTPISPVYTSHEVKHQIEDSDAKTVVCEDILYDNVEKSGITLDHVILTNIGDYLPALETVHGQGGAWKALSGNEGSHAQVHQRGRAAPVSGSHEVRPCTPPAAHHRHPKGHRRASLHRRDHRASQGGHAHPLQHDGPFCSDHRLLALFRGGERGDHRLPALFPHLRPGGGDAHRSGSGLDPGPFHHPGHRRHPGGHGAIPGLGLLRCADPVRIPEGVRKDRPGELETAQADCLRRRHASRIDRHSLGEADGDQDTRGLRHDRNHCRQSRQPCSDGQRSDPSAFRCPASRPPSSTSRARTSCPSARSGR